MLSLVAIGVINKDSNGRGVIGVTFQGGTVHSVDQPLALGLGNAHFWDFVIENVAWIAIPGVAAFACRSEDAGGAVDSAGATAVTERVASTASLVHIIRSTELWYWQRQRQSYSKAPACTG